MKQILLFIIIVSWKYIKDNVMSILAIMCGLLGIMFGALKVYILLVIFALLFLFFVIKSNQYNEEERIRREKNGR